MHRKKYATEDAVRSQQSLRVDGHRLAHQLSPRLPANRFADHLPPGEQRDEQKRSHRNIQGLLLLHVDTRTDVSNNQLPRLLHPQHHSNQ